MHYLIAHAPWAPGRAQALARLKERLPSGMVNVIASRGREHASIWARRVWERASDQAGSADHVCILNDDVVLTSDFCDRIKRAVAALPDEPISLHCGNPNVATVTGSWARCYHYSGPGVILPPGAAADLLDYVYTLPWSFLSRVNEDVIANAWAWDRQRPFWYLLPSPLVHDTSVPSTLGYDNHPHRQPVLVGPERDVTIADKALVPFVELNWSHTEALRYQRLVLQTGQLLCTMCQAREGVVGNKADQLCRECLAQLAGMAIRCPSS